MSSWDEEDIFGNPEKIKNDKKDNNIYKVVASISIIPDIDIIELGVNEEKIIIAQVKYKDNSTSNNVGWDNSENKKITLSFTEDKKIKCIASELGTFKITIFSEEDISKNKEITINIVDNHFSNTLNNKIAYESNLEQNLGYNKNSFIQTINKLKRGI